MSSLRRCSVPVVLVLLAMSACAAPAAVREHPRPHDTGDQDAVDDALSIDQGWHGEDSWVVSPPLGAEGGATHVSALLVTADTAPLFALEARGLMLGEPVGDWVALGETFAEENQHVVEADLAGPIDSVQVRIPAADTQSLVQAHWSVSAIVPEEELDGDDSGGSPIAGATVALRAELSGYGIVTRAEWGARRTSCGPADASKYRITIHHTETGSSNPAAQLRSIQAYHISKGWCDIGYHFLVGSDGRLYEGRPLEIKGVHTLSNNTGNVGIAFVGSFDGSPPSDAMLDVVARLMGSLSALYGIDLSSTSTKGHRDLVDTTCPGGALYARIGDLIAAGRTETLGDTAPPPPPPPPPGLPPAGASCTHSFGGRYGHTACSASYQCCDGAWRSRSSGACGGCACVEETGLLGCGIGGTPAPMPAPTPAPGTPYAGLTQSGSEIPRAGLSNATLRSTLGISTEPYGTVVSVGGDSWVQGRISWFGGPSDTGVSSTETVALTGERARALNSPMHPTPAQLAARPADFYYCAMRWAYSPSGPSFWRAARILVRNPTTGTTIVVRPADWGPNTSTHRVIDLSPQSLADLGLDTDDEVQVAFAAPGTPLGVLR